MKRLLCLTPMLLLTACTGSLFKSQATPTAVYLLSATGASGAAGTAASGSEVAVLPVDLAILKPRVRAGLNSDRVVVLYPDGRLDFLAGARWSGSLDEVVQDLSVQVLHAARRFRSVNADASAFASGYWLEISVVDFQAEYATAMAAPTIHVHFLANLGGAVDRRVLGRFEASARQAATDNRLTAIVEAYTAAANTALAELAADTANALAPGSIAH